MYSVLWNICTLTVTVTTAQPALVLLARCTDIQILRWTNLPMTIKRVYFCSLLRKLHMNVANITPVLTPPILTTSNTLMSVEVEGQVLVLLSKWLVSAFCYCCTPFELMIIIPALCRAQEASGEETEEPVVKRMLKDEIIRLTNIKASSKIRSVQRIMLPLKFWNLGPDSIQINVKMNFLVSNLTFQTFWIHFAAAACLFISLSHSYLQEIMNFLWSWLLCALPPPAGHWSKSRACRNEVL